MKENIDEICFSTKRERVLMALLSTNSIEEASLKCGVSVSKILQLWDDESFKREYKKALNFLDELNFMIRLLEIIGLQNKNTGEKQVQN